MNVVKLKPKQSLWTIKIEVLIMLYVKAVSHPIFFNLKITQLLLGFLLMKLFMSLSSFRKYPYPCHPMEGQWKFQGGEGGGHGGGSQRPKF